jgi:8-oxo-dGTP pyrophosphatase MutT (NUDIX family)
MPEIKTAIDYDQTTHTPPWRCAVLIVLLDQDNKIWIGERNEERWAHAPWQMPQGGINARFENNQMIAGSQELPATAARREIAEELGDAVRVTIERIGTPVTLPFLDISPKYCGQKFWPILARYEGGAFDLSKIEAGHGKPAFNQGDFFPIEEVLQRVTPERLDLYQTIFSMFHLIPNSTVSAPVSNLLWTERKQPQ